MSRSRHTEAQIIAALKQVEAIRRTEDGAREQGVSKHIIYACKAKYRGLEVSEAEEVKHLREENAQMKRLAVELRVEEDMLQSAIRKKPWARRTESAGPLLIDPVFFIQRCAINMVAGNSDVPCKVRGHSFPLILKSICFPYIKHAPSGVITRLIGTGSCLRSHTF